MVRIARVYQEPKGPGPRFLVERLWPRGMRKEALQIDAWLKEVAPSPALRTWFGHRPERWDEFQRRYRDELTANEAALKPLFDAAENGDVTLLYSARDEERNSARLLKGFIEERLSPRRKRGKG